MTGFYSRSDDAVIRVYDESWQRDRDARAQGRFQRVVSLRLSACPAKRWRYKVGRILVKAFFWVKRLTQKNFRGIKPSRGGGGNTWW
jgi:hypothetical protein